MRAEGLAARWEALVRRSGADPARAAPHLRRLLAAHAEPHRAYHGVAHLEHVLDELDAVPHGDPAVEWAAWYHDAVYRPGRRDNEARSAALVRAALADLGLGALAPRAAALVLATRTHRADPADAPALLLLDADLAILGAGPAAYARYADAVRREHGALPDRLWASGRRAFLAAMLARPAIFATPHFAARYERRARENLAQELSRLSRR